MFSFSVGIDWPNLLKDGGKTTESKNAEDRLNDASQPYNTLTGILCVGPL